MVELRASSAIPLQTLLPQLPLATYRASRPCRVYWKWNSSVAVQIFPRGCIQILGNHSLETYDRICEEMRQLLAPYGLDVSDPITKSCTVQCQWNYTKDRMQTIQQLPSTSVISNERELFPGTLIRKGNLHCSFFSNGSVIVTGVLSIAEAESLVEDILKSLFEGDSLNESDSN